MWYTGLCHSGMEAMVVTGKRRTQHHGPQHMARGQHVALLGITLYQEIGLGWEAASLEKGMLAMGPCDNT